MAVPRRRAAGLIAGMRLGDLSAALESRRLRRAEESADREQEQARLRAGAQAVREIVGGIAEHRDAQARAAAAAGDAAERARAASFERDLRGRAAKLAEERAAREAAMHDISLSEKKRESSSKEKAERLAVLSPEARRQAAGLLDSDIVGGLSFDLGADAVEEQSPDEARLASIRSFYTDAGLSPMEAQGLAASILAEERSSREKERLAAEERAGRGKLSDSRIDLESARAELARAQAKRAGRPSPGPRSARARPGAASSTGEVKSAATRKWLGGVNAVLSSFKSALELAESSGVDTGEFREHVEDPARRFLGVPNKDREEIRSRLAQGLAKWKNEMIGANQTKRELLDLAPALPTLDREPEVFLPRLRLFIEGLERNRDEVLAAEGVDAARPEGHPAAPDRPARAGEAAESMGLRSELLGLAEAFSDMHGRPPDDDELADLEQLLLGWPAQ